MTPSDQYGRRNSAFSLVELVMMMAAIVVLVGIVVGSTRWIMESARESKTKAVLRVLAAISTEFEAEIGHPVPMPVEDDMQQDLKANKRRPRQGDISKLGLDTYWRYVCKHGKTIGHFLNKVQQVQSASQLIGNLDDGVLLEIPATVDGDDFTCTVKNDSGSTVSIKRVVVDAWETPIRYRPLNDFSLSNDSKMLPERSTPFFASAGPDRQWGNYTETDKSLDAFKWTQDNVFSFGVE